MGLFGYRSTSRGASTASGINLATPAVDDGAPNFGLAAQNQVSAGQLQPPRLGSAGNGPPRLPANQTLPFGVNDDTTSPYRTRPGDGLQPMAVADGMAPRNPAAAADKWFSTISRVAAHETGDSGYSYADPTGAPVIARVEPAAYRRGSPSHKLTTDDLARLYDRARATREEFDTVQQNRLKAGKGPYGIGILGGPAGFLMNIGTDRPALDVRNSADVRPFMEDLAGLRAAKGMCYATDASVLGDMGTPKAASVPGGSVPNMGVSAKGIDFIKSYEQGPKGGPALKPYPSPEGGTDTIGWGHKIKAGEDFSGGIKRDQADALFLKDLRDHSKFVSDRVDVPLSQNQFDALVSMGYNVPSAFRKIRKKSTLLHDLEAGNYTGAADQMLVWDKGGRPLKVMKGLQTRRAAERDIFLNGAYTNHIVGGQ